MKTAKFVCAAAALAFIATAASAQEAKTGLVTQIDRLNGTIAIQQPQEGTVGAGSSGTVKQYKVQGSSLEALHAGDQVVGYAKLALSSAREHVVMHDLTGVLREWRGRGIAAALKRTQIAWAKHAGFAKLETSNEVRNEPIRRLNERHGYVPEPGQISLLGPTAST